MRTRKFTVGKKELTITEVRVLILDMYCFARKDAAGYLGRSPNTVKTHIRNIYEKCDLRGQRDLQRFGFEHGFYNAGYFQGEYLFSEFVKLPW
jgi:DNA-binding NarL/FixJ family response regulator